MKNFPLAHATHPQWRMAAALVLAQLRAQLALPGASHPTLALLYITDHYAAEAEAILGHLSAELPEVTDWAGTVGVGIAATNVEYFDEPALAVMLCDLPADQYRVFSGVAPLGLGFEPHTALVHADGHTPELSELISEMAGRTDSGYLFGGLAASRGDSVQFALGGDGFIRGQGRSTGVFHGGLSGVAFSEGVRVVSRVTQGCCPVAGSHTITEAERNVVYQLDGEPALQVLLRELDVTLDEPERAISTVRATLAGLVSPQDVAAQADGGGRAINRTGNFGSDVRVRHIVGLDPQRSGVALAEIVEPGMQLAFCQRNVQAARADLMRICAEIREELEPEELPLTVPSVGGEAEPVVHQPQRMVGAVYVSCSGRGGPHFGGPSAELQIVRHALGDVPLIGFFAGGEIARHHVYGYTGVLTVFLAD
ncbi:MAG: FIST C-terminal domain-containing protein [Hylemonella sp.]|nr:FIST C-terminal domain-containing protein [Hylemonella sp.]